MTHGEVVRPEVLETRLAFDETLMPDELKTYPHWVVWAFEFDEGKWKKRPKFLNLNGQIRNASTTNPRTWMPYDLALATAREHRLGIGFMLSKHEGHENPFVFVDIDLHPSDPVVEELIRTFGTYTELSPSRSGVHMIFKGRLPGTSNRTGPFETYETSRWMTMTGEQIPGTNLLIADTNDAFEQFYATHIHTEAKEFDLSQLVHLKTPESITTVEDLLAAAEARPHSVKARRLLSLYRTGMAENYVQNDQSRKDVYFLTLAAEIAGNQPALLDEFFRRSFLWTEKDREGKWGRLITGHPYGERTILLALQRAAQNVLEAAEWRKQQLQQSSHAEYADSGVHTIPQR